MGSRPTGVTLVAIWAFLGGLWDVVGGGALAFALSSMFGLLGGLLGILGGAGSGAGLGSMGLVFQIMGIILVLVGFARFVLGWGLLEAKPWAQRWSTLAFALSAIIGLGLIVVLFVPLGGFALGALLPVLVPAVLDLLSLVYLMGQEARAWLGVGASRGGSSTVVRDRNLVVIGDPAPPIGDPVPPDVVTAPRRPPAPTPTQLVNPEPAPAAWLVTRGGQRSQRQFVLRPGRTVMGRDGTRCQVCLEDDTVSTEHAAVVFEQNRFYVQDLASRNGTFVNGERVQRRMLYDGDEVQLGNTVLIFKKA